MKNKITLILISFFSIFIFKNCIDDVTLPSFSFQTEDSALLLLYLEGKGDYINSNEMPSLIEATEVYQNLSSYLIIDVRSETDFMNGHIQGSLNVSNKDLFKFIDSVDVNLYPKIVVVSQTGQSAAYYASLLRIAGIGNIYSMNFGMAYWNNDFSELWLSHSKTFSGIVDFNNQDYLKNPITKLPSVLFDISLSIQEEVNKRIEQLIIEGFSDYPTSVSQYINSFTIEDIYDNLNKYYLICFGSPELYYTGSALSGDPLFGYGHPPETRIYLPQIDFRSTDNLQTLPVDKTIVIYSYSGQRSAYVCAYLKLIGYVAKSLLFGANNLIYPRMLWNSNLNEYAFKSSLINNYPYVTRK
jgi:rhodanese-related sulfurtransferase